MPHRCLGCSRVVPDGANLARGCPACGQRTFFYTNPILEAKESAAPAPADDERIWSWESREAWLRRDD